MRPRPREVYSCFRRCLLDLARRLDVQLKAREKVRDGWEGMERGMAKEETQCVN